MSKKNIALFKFALALTLALVASLSISNAGAIPSGLAQSDPPDPPDRGTPIGDPTPGGTRPEAICEETEIELTALIQNAGSDLTASESPTLWFYVPYESEKVGYMEFSLHDSEDTTIIYRTQVKLEGQPGIIKIAIPPGGNFLPEHRERFRWYFSLDCDGNTEEGFDLVVNGWLQWLQIDLADANQDGDRLYTIYREKGIWLDAITNLGERYFANSEDRQIEEKWTELLKDLRHEDLANIPLVQFELLAPEE